MVKNKKILVIVDTNKIGNYQKGNLECKNYNYLEINKHLHESLVNNFNFKSSENIKIEVAIPAIVLEELKQQQNECFIRDFKKIHEVFSKFSKIGKFKLNFPEINYVSHLNTKSASYLGKYKITEIKLPSQETFSKIIQKVLKKEKPFYKKNKETDSGFKDALIWESILEFVRENKHDRYFFLTNDEDFMDNLLSQEFFQVAKKEIEIVKEIADLKGLLEEEIRGTRLINEAIKKIEVKLKDNLREMIYKNYIEIIPQLYEVKDIVDYQILDINQTSEGFDISLLIYLEHESAYSLHARYGAIDQAFLHHTDISPEEINLIIDENYDIKKIKSDDILINLGSELNF